MSEVWFIVYIVVAVLALGGNIWLVEYSNRLSRRNQKKSDNLL